MTRRSKLPVLLAGRWQTFAVALFHLAALALTARLAHWPYPFVLLALASIVLPFRFYLRLKHPPTQSPNRPANGSLNLTTCLTPLLALYTVTALRLGLALVHRALCPTCNTYLAVPEPFARWLSFDWAALFSLSAIAVLQAARALPVSFHGRLAAFALAAMAGVWMGVLLPRLVPAGVTGADPFAYTQMGLDLATRGTPLHHFPLAGLARDLNLPIYPTLFVGYTILHNGESATVWPPGFSALLALAYRLGGEAGLYRLNPLLGLVCAGATYALARRAFRLSPFFSLLAAALLLTSLEQTIRLSIPLADLAAQLFTTAALTLALNGSSPAGNWTATLRGRTLRVESESVGFGLVGALAGLAFVTRYTQLLSVPGLLYILLTRHTWPENEPDARYVIRNPYCVARILYHALRITYRLLPFTLACLLVTLPDTLYRTQAFGSPLAFATGELAQFSTADILPVSLRLLAEIGIDFNFATPFILVGLITFVRTRRLVALGLAASLGPVVLFHLPYHYLKLRDLLFIFPALCALAALGCQQLAARTGQQTGQPPIDQTSPAPLSRSGLRRVTWPFVIIWVLVAFRFSTQLPLLNGYYTYGFLTAEGRAHLESIARLTPPEAVIAASLNSGAITLYSGRDTVRPGRLLQPGRTWTEAEFLALVAALHARQRPLYLLADGEEMAEPLAVLAGCCRLTPIAELYLPYYYRSGSASNEIVALYRIDRR